MFDVLIRAAGAPPEAPPDDKVVAGWLAFWIFVGLIAAVVVLCWSFVRQLRKAERAKEAGVLFSDKDAKAARAAADDEAHADK
ncbi:hypothetical protein [Nocardioides montaniterrae]